MIEVKLPCHNNHVMLRVDEKYLCGLLQPQVNGMKLMDSQTIVSNAMKHPIGSPLLTELAAGCKSAVIVCSDHTRPVPSRIILPAMLEALRRSSPQIDITLLIATGFHRSPTRAELLCKFDEEIFNHERIFVHDCMDEAMLVRIGALPSGAELIVNRLAVETDLLLAEGFVEPHFFAGFSGGRKSILPGISSWKTIMANHCAAFINSPSARTGILEGNPIHTDMLAAANMVDLKFILNVVLNADKKIIAAFAGNPIQAHGKGCGYLSGISRVPSCPADIVIVTNGGYPLDQNIYQCVKGLTAAEATAKEDAVIIMVAGCTDGTGGEHFFATLKNAASAAHLLARISLIPRDDTMPDQWQSQILARILSKHKVILAASSCERHIVEDMKLLWAETVDDAVDMARKIKGREASISVIPDGVSVIVR